MMFPPDRMIAHNLRPTCPGSSELCAYMDREWGSTTAFLRRPGRGKEPAEPLPLPLETKVVRPAKARLRIPFL